MNKTLFLPSENSNREETPTHYGVLHSNTEVQTKCYGNTEDEVLLPVEVTENSQRK